MRFIYLNLLMIFLFGRQCGSNEMVGLCSCYTTGLLCLVTHLWCAEDAPIYRHKNSQKTSMIWPMICLLNNGKGYSSLLFYSTRKENSFSTFSIVSVIRVGFLCVSSLFVAWIALFTNTQKQLMNSRAQCLHTEEQKEL